VLKKSLHDHYFVFLTKHLILAFFSGRGRERGGDEFLHCGDNVFFGKCGKIAKLSKPQKLGEKKKQKKNHACHK